MFGSPMDVEVTAECMPRRLVLWGLLAKGTRSVEVETNRGVFAGRVEALPQPFRDPRNQPQYLRTSHTGSAFVVAIPGDAAPRALVIRGRRTVRHGLGLPPASAQCGYEDSVLTF